MLKNLSQLECKIGEKLYHFSCDYDSPINEVKEALFQFQNYIGQIENQAKAQLEAQLEAQAEAQKKSEGAEDEEETKNEEKPTE